MKYEIHQAERSPQRKVWTREETKALIELFPGKRYELIDGDLIDKTGQKPVHACLITLLTTIISQTFVGRVRVQLPISLPDPDGIISEPEPDVVILKSSSPEFSRRHPGPQDIALLIEVSDSTLQFDREVKGRLYGRCGIESYGIIDLQQRRVIVLQGPSGDEYRSVRIFQIGEAADFGVLSLDVQELFAAGE